MLQRTMARRYSLKLLFLLGLAPAWPIGCAVSSDGAFFSCDEGSPCKSGWVCEQGVCVEEEFLDRACEDRCGLYREEKHGLDLDCGSCPEEQHCTSENLCVACDEVCADLECGPAPGVAECYCGTCASATCGLCEQASCTDSGQCGCELTTAGGPCDDGDPCTQGDQCDPKGHCSGERAADGASCDDADPCTEHDQCSDGVCTGTYLPCDDDEPCTVDPACEPETGHCPTPIPADDGLGCEDGAGTTFGESCLNGVCGGGTRRRGFRVTLIELVAPELQTSDGTTLTAAINDALAEIIDAGSDSGFFVFAMMEGDWTETSGGQLLLGEATCAMQAGSWSCTFDDEAEVVTIADVSFSTQAPCTHPVSIPAPCLQSSSSEFSMEMILGHSGEPSLLPPIPGRVSGHLNATGGISEGWVTGFLPVDVAKEALKTAAFPGVSVSEDFLSANPPEPCGSGCGNQELMGWPVSFRFVAHGVVEQDVIR